MTIWSAILAECCKKWTISKRRRLLVAMGSISKREIMKSFINTVLDGWHNLKVWQKFVCIVLICLAVSCIILATLETVRIFIIHKVETQVVHRSLNILHWSRWLKKFGILSLLLVASFFALVIKAENVACLLKRKAVEASNFVVLVAKQNRRLLPYILSAIPLLATITRAVSSAITWDEAVTYMDFALPLSRNIGRLFRMFEHSIANNHLLNTFLIAAIDRITQVHYNECLIRLPAIMFACLFYYALARYREQNKICWAEFALLGFSYYLNEFMGLARGYGMSACLVFIALVQFKKYIATSSLKRFWATCFVLLLSAFANTVSLLVFCALGLVALFILIRRGELLQLIKQNTGYVAVCVFLLFITLRYHFNAINTTGDKSLYSVHAVDFVFYVREYLFLATHLSTFPIPLLYIIAVLFIVVSVYCAIVILQRPSGGGHSLSHLFCILYCYTRLEGYSNMALYSNVFFCHHTRLLLWA